MKVGILCGGKSAEHEISLRSANNIYQCLRQSKHIEPILIGISKKGDWLYREDNQLLLFTEKSQQPQLNEQARHVVLPPAAQGQLWELGGNKLPFRLHAIFPILHGPLGEDGATQGLLKISETPFVGPDILGAAIGMDKEVMKRLLHEAGIPIAPYLCLRKEDPPLSFLQAQTQLGTPLYIKPANMGSSIGISKINSEKQWKQALQLAFRYDTKIIIEQNIIGRELECAVLGNEYPRASTVGEITSHDQFYDYEAKYISQEAAQLNIPADLPTTTIARIQEIAIKTYKALECQGLGRVDVFLKPNGEILVNEINTLPGFTNISMYPKLWEHSGLTYLQLIEELIRLAIKRHRQQQKIYLT